MKKFLVLISVFLSSYCLFAQEEKVYEHFKNTRIINLQSVESLPPGILELKISHRFGAFTDGATNLFGLDIATMRIGLEQGLTKNLMMGVGRSTYQKTFDAFIKWRILSQKKEGMPISLSFLSTLNVNGVPFDKSRVNYFSSRLAYVNQLIISSKLNDIISFQVSPTIVHKNLVPYALDKNTIFTIGMAGTYNLTNNLSFNLEYIARVNPKENFSPQTYYYNSFSAGLGIETKGHFFELHLTNSMPMVETGFITETNDTWLKGNIHPGFNMVRDFRVYKKK